MKEKVSSSLTLERAFSRRSKVAVGIRRSLRSQPCSLARITRPRFARTRNPLRVAVGLSGGVDSAVTAALLKEQGCEVIGVHLYCWDKGPYCTADKDRASALRVAKHLNIPFVVWDLRKEYEEKVIDYFFDEYRKGRTPNPDVMCNREIKFGIFMEKALRELKINKVATGHYARVARKVRGEWQIVNSEWLGTKKKDFTTSDPEPFTINHKLLTGRDAAKDQSYFLWILTPKQLERIIFPIGHMTKKEVRAKAEELDLPCAERPDSQGICFIGPVNVAKFLRERLPIKSGPVVNTKGEVIGEHDGVWFYTEGQRRGFRVFKPGYPLYVIKKDLKANTLVVGRGKEAEVKEFEVGEINWISQSTVDSKQLTAGVRIRHLGEIYPAKIKMVHGKLLHVTSEDPIFGVAPGQSVVFYQNEEVLGGGVIEEAAIVSSSLRSDEQ